MEWPAPHRDSFFRRMRPLHCTLSVAFCSAASRVILSTPVNDAASLLRTQDSQLVRGLPNASGPFAMLWDPMQKIVGYSFFWHPHHMTKPSESSCLDKYIYRSDVSSLQYFSIRHEIVPSDLQDFSQTALMEHFKSLHLRLGGIPNLTSIE